MNKQVLDRKKYIRNKRKAKPINSRRGMGKVSKEITCDKETWFVRESEKERETVPPKVASINPLLCGLSALPIECFAYR